MILYFSASGNSRFVAESVAEMLSDDMVCLNERIKKKDYSEIHSDRPFILVCPVFAWRIPKIVEEYLKNTTLSGNDKVLKDFKVTYVGKYCCFISNHCGRGVPLIA